VPRILGFVVSACAWTAIVWVAACVGDAPSSSTAAGAETGADDTSTPVDANARDTSAPGDSTTGPACDRSKAFGAPVPVTSLNTAAGEYQPWLSSDGLTVHFTRKDGDGRNHLWTASRPRRDADFGTARRLDELVTDFSEKGASLTGDGLFIYFASAADGGTNTELWASTSPRTLE